MAKLTARGCTTLLKMRREREGVRIFYAVRSDGWVLQRYAFRPDSSRPWDQGSWKLYRRLKRGAGLTERAARFAVRLRAEGFEEREITPAVRCAMQQEEMGR
jgi:hypothetical protein